MPIKARFDDAEERTADLPTKKQTVFQKPKKADKDKEKEKERGKETEINQSVE